MKELTKAEVTATGKTVYDAAIGTCHTIASDEFYAVIGRAAVAAVAPLVLVEPDSWEVREIRARTETYTTVVKAVISDFLAARLARLTAKPEPAVEAALQEAIAVGWVFENIDHTKTRADMARIIAAVDAARAKQ